MNRERRAEIGQQTLRILETGEYVAPSGRTVSLRDELARAVHETHLYLPEEPLPAPVERYERTAVSVQNETTLAAALRLVLEGRRVLALNFASANNPGGGFLSGSQAQEESLARASGLYACLNGSPYYVFHRAQQDAFYSHRAIHSPGVPVFRTDSGELVEDPWRCDFLTCPAVNRGALLDQHRAKGEDVEAVMRARIERILNIASAQGHDTLVLGAFGCGVFRNDPTDVARWFRDELDGAFHGAFERVQFAVLDRDGGPAIAAFESVFAPAPV